MALVTTASLLTRPGQSTHLAGGEGIANSAGKPSASPTGKAVMLPAGDSVILSAGEPVPLSTGDPPDLAPAKTLSMPARSATKSGRHGATYHNLGGGPVQPAPGNRSGRPYLTR